MHYKNLHFYLSGYPSANCIPHSLVMPFPQFNLYPFSLLFGEERRKEYHVKNRDSNDNCLPREAFWTSSWLQTAHPLSKLAKTWAAIKSTMAANPSLYASWLGSLHSNNHNLKCFSYPSIQTHTQKKRTFNPLSSSYKQTHLHIYQLRKQ